MKAQPLVAAVVAGAAVAAGSAFAAAPKTAIVGNAKTGKSLFKAHQCGSCHLMAAANAFNGSGAGPDLDQTKKSYTQIVNSITKGGAGMTGYRGALTTVQIEDLAAFIYTTAQSAANSGSNGY